jgi:porphobilinogen deaminase
VKRQLLTPKQLDALTRVGAAHPVFQSQGAILIALPEVRVEESSSQRRRALLRWIREHAEVAEIVDNTGEKIALRPTSGQGADAITLANQLVEQIGPELAQPRFLRVIEHFGAAI